MERHYTNLISEYLEYFPVVAIIGARQVGKSTLLQSFKDWKIYDLERGADFEQISSDPDHFLSLHPKSIAIDEAQLLPSLFPALRVAVDANREQKGRFLITGSSSPEILTSISESLAGRVGIIEISPFSLHEVRQQDSSLLTRLAANKNIDRELINKLNAHTNYKDIQKFWLRGGYPEPWINTKERFRQVWMDNYVTTYLQRDLKKLFPKIDDIRFRKFLSVLSGLSGQVINYSEIARTLDTSQPTIKDYFHIAHHTFLWRQIPAFNKDSQKRLVKNPKGHIRDSGLLNYLQRIVNADQLQTHPLMGRLWEAFVIEEILRTLNTKGADYEYSYYRTSSGAEIDLVLEGAFGLLPIEIKHTQKVTAKSLVSLKNFVNEYNCSLGIVINNDIQCRWYSEKIVGIPMAFL